MAAAGGAGTNTTRPRWALGQCDICGFHYRLNDLKEVIYDQRPTGSLACPTCWDLDNPQLQLGRTKIFDPQSLSNPRPDINRPGSTGLFGWLPIGNPLTNIQCQVGTITVLIA
tara:strand:- start:117 stop:455 length:339 start_codon:yes stop_codon:yes gene_type:complete